jgi:uncharacterized phage protein gp47/JayE
MLFQKEQWQAYLKFATGRKLDMLGELMGVPRLPAVRASATSAQKVQRFYVANGIFGDINGGVAFTIPAGTLIFSTPRDATQTPIRYLSKTDTVCNPPDNEVFVSIGSVEFGPGSNIGVKALNQHGFSNYSDYASRTLLTENIESISYARDLESDNNYKYRISQQSLAGETANEVAIRIAALAVPGVANVYLSEFSRGIGTGSIYVKAVTPTVPTALLADVLGATRTVRAWGNLVDVRAPKTIGVELAVRLNLYKQLNQVQRSDLVSRVRNNLVAYINSLDITDSLTITELVGVVTDSDSNIKSIGTLEKPFDSIRIWKESEAEDNRVPRLLVGDYTPQGIERIVVEYSIDNPITVLV